MMETTSTYLDLSVPPYPHRLLSTRESSSSTVIQSLVIPRTRKVWEPGGIPVTGSNFAFRVLIVLPGDIRRSAKTGKVLHSGLEVTEMRTGMSCVLLAEAIAAALLVSTAPCVGAQLARGLDVDAEDQRRTYPL